MKSLLWKPIYLIIILVGLGGCESVGAIFESSGFEAFNQVREKGVEVGDAVLDSAADAADKYCVVPRAVRIWFRAEINSRTEIATITVTCEGM